MPDHRRHPRQAVRQPVKIACEAWGPRYLPAETCNISDGGVYLELDETVRLALTPGFGPAVGSDVRVSLPAASKRVLSAREDLVNATVVRVDRTGVALKFDVPMPLSMAA